MLQPPSARAGRGGQAVSARNVLRMALVFPLVVMELVFAAICFASERCERTLAALVNAINDTLRAPDAGRTT